MSFARMSLLASVSSLMAVAQLAPSDNAFLKDMILASRLEVDIGQLATQKGWHNRVKAFGQMVVNSQGKINVQLEALAKEKGLVIPMKERLPLPLQLTQIKGKAFDHEYCLRTVENHEKVLAAFQKEAQDAADPEIKAFATRMVPTLLTNLDLARGVKH